MNAALSAPSAPPTAARWTASPPQTYSGWMPLVVEFDSSRLSVYRVSGEPMHKPVLRTPDDLSDFWGHHLGPHAGKDLADEGLTALFLDRRCRLLGYAITRMHALIGWHREVSTEPFNPMEIFRAATLLQCETMVLIHNRPNLVRHYVDVLAVGLMVRMCEVLGMKFLDYVLLYNNDSSVLNSVSFRHLEANRIRREKLAAKRARR